MGEEADFIIDQMMDRWDSHLGYCGRQQRRAALIKTCDHCGESNLRWGNVKGGAWRLHTTDGELHVCPPAIEQIRGLT